MFDARQGGAEALFTYLVSGHDLAQGDLVLAPIGTRSGLGVVWKVYDVDPGSLGYDPSKLRSILERLDEFSLPAPLVKLVESVAEEFLCPLSVALSAALPPGVLDRLEERWTVVDGAGTMPLSTLQQETLDGIQASGGKVVRSKTKKLSAPVLKALKTLQAKGLLQKSVGVAAPKESRATAA